MKKFTTIGGLLTLFIFNGALLVAQPAMVKDINGGSAGCSPITPAVVVNGIGYFMADDGAVGVELWRTDGTTTGTQLVKDINPGINSSNPNELVNIANVLYFSADDGTNGRELWKSDGTESGTVMVANINDSAGIGSTPTHIRSMGTYIVFAANDGLHGNEIWRSDGTSAGTMLIKDINATIVSYDTTASSNPIEILRAG
ncbi:MAG TPA: ELWxxDGT repeat protein, partial [Cytophagaceae bacterium]|nr:ELWxxDGT repeat protein [Cytophagaceae bacterium]